MTKIDGVDLPHHGTQQPVILLVEDEVLIPMATSEYLQECGFRVLEASTAVEAIEMLQGSDTHIDLVFTDIRMPGELDGFGLARWVKAHRPGMEVLLTSGDASMADAATGLCHKLDLVRKPYDFHSTVAKIRALLAKPAQTGAQQKV